MFLYALELSDLVWELTLNSSMAFLKWDLFLQLTRISLDPIQLVFFSPARFDMQFLSHCI